MNADGTDAPRRFTFLGGALPLDFCNTVDWHSGPDPTDRLHRYEDIVEWAEAAGTISPEEGRALRKAAFEETKEAANAYRESIAFREALFRLFSDLAHGMAPNQEDLERLNRQWRKAQERMELRYAEGAFHWRGRRGGTSDRPADFLRLLDPIARETVELLLSPKLRAVRRCEGPPGCGWLFLDTTKNRSRRWCSMQDCGNRAKMRRYQQRKKEQGEG